MADQVTATQNANLAITDPDLHPPFYTPHGHKLRLFNRWEAQFPATCPGIVRDFELPGNSWQIRQVAGV